MKLTIATARYVKTADGHLWSPYAYHGYSFWERYFSVFDRVTLLARCRPAAEAPAAWHRATGSRVGAVCVPDFHAPLELARVLPAVVRRARRALRAEGAILFRTSSDPFVTLAARLIPRGKPYGVEVIGDPYEVYRDPEGAGGLGAVYAWLFRHELRRQCRNACVAAYVTESTLQQRYPPNPREFTTYYSSIDLPRDAFRGQPRRFDRPPRPLRLVIVGSLATRYKGHDLLIKAVGMLNDEGVPCELTVAGDGALRGEFEALVHMSGVAAQVTFTGMLPARDDVIRVLDRSHVFVLPSRTDAMPRALIEAMARGLPCIGANVGGIPELLDPEALVLPENARALADKVKSTASDPGTLNRLAARNLGRARRFERHALGERREQFLRALALATARTMSRP